MSFMQELLAENKPLWDQCVETPFVKELKEGTLCFDKFKSYLIQDSIYLQHYSHVYGKAIYCSKTFEDIEQFYSALSIILGDEADYRLTCLAPYGITDEDLEQTKPHPVNQNYIDFLEGAAKTDDLLEMLMAILPCMLGYSYVFKKIAPDAKPSEYSDFIRDYASGDFAEMERCWCAFTDKKCKGLTAEEEAKYAGIFKRASELELAFWNMSYEA